MTAKLYTIRHFAAAICAAEGRSNPDAVFNQLKGLQGRGLLNSTGMFAVRGAVLYEEIECYRARLLIAALDAGVTSDDLAKLNRFIADNLEKVSTKLDDFWLLEIARIRDRETDLLGIYPGWCRNEYRFDRPPLLTAPGEGDEILSLAGTIESVLLIRASDLLRPIAKQIASAV